MRSIGWWVSLIDTFDWLVDLIDELDLIDDSDMIDWWSGLNGGKYSLMDWLTIRIA